MLMATSWGFLAWSTPRWMAGNGMSVAEEPKIGVKKKTRSKQNLNVFLCFKFHHRLNLFEFCFFSFFLIYLRIRRPFDCLLLSLLEFQLPGPPFLVAAIFD